jgi:type II secretory pathway component PulF
MIIIVLIFCAIVYGIFLLLALFRKGSLEFRNRFTEHMTLVTGRNLPLRKGIAILAADLPGRRVAVLRSILDDLEGGCDLSAALARFPRIFPSHYVDSVAVGEAKGNLYQVFRGLEGDEIEVLAFRHRLHINLIYPTLLSLLIIATSLFTLPKYIQMARASALDFPRTIAIFRYLAWAGPAFFLAIGAVAVWLLLYRLWLGRWESLRRIADRILFSIPHVRKYTIRRDLGRQLACLGSLLEAGVALPQAYKLATAIDMNRSLQRKLLKVAKGLEDGDSLGTLWGRIRSIPRGVRWRIATGESSGKLPEAARKVGRALSEDANRSLRRAGEFIYPAFVLVFGVVVGFLYVSTYFMVTRMETMMF